MTIGHPDEAGLTKEIGNLPWIQIKLVSKKKNGYSWWTVKLLQIACFYIFLNNSMCLVNTWSSWTVFLFDHTVYYLRWISVCVCMRACVHACTHVHGCMCVLVAGNILHSPKLPQKSTILIWLTTNQTTKFFLWNLWSTRPWHHLHWWCVNTVLVTKPHKSWTKVLVSVMSLGVLSVFLFQREQRQL